MSFTFLYFLYADFKSCSSSRKEETNAYIIGGVVGLFIIFLILGLLAWKGCLRGKKKEEKGMGYIVCKCCLVLIHCIFCQISSIGTSALYLRWFQI